MHGMKAKVLDEILEYLNKAQGDDLHSMLKGGSENEEKLAEASLEQTDAADDAASMVEGEGKPKGLKIESIEVMGKPEVAMGKSPQIDPEKAKQMQEGATQSGWQPDKWKENLKKGLGMQAQNEALEPTDEELAELIQKYMKG